MQKRMLLVLCSVLLSVGVTSCDSDSKDDSSTTSSVKISAPSEALAGETVRFELQMNNQEPTPNYQVFLNGEFYSSGFEDYVDIVIPYETKDQIHTVRFELNSGASSVVVSHKISATYQFNFAFEQESVAHISHVAANYSLLTSKMVKQYLSIEYIESKEQTTACYNGGLVEITYSDTDTNGQISATDILSLIFKECQLWPGLSKTASGTAKISIGKMTNLNAFEASVNFNHFELSSLYQTEADSLNGTLNMEFLSTEYEDIVKVLSVENLTAIQYDTTLLLFGEFQFNHQLNYQKASYTMDFSGAVTIDDRLSLSFSHEKPVFGYIGEYPHSSKLTFVSPDSAEMTIESAFVVDSGYLNLSTSQSKYQYSWLDIVSPLLWNILNTAEQSPQAHRLDNFNYIGSMTDLDNVSVNGGISLLFSRAVANIESQDLYFELSDWPHDVIQALVEYEGAVVRIRPVTPLEPATEYRLSDIVALAEMEDTSSHAYFNLFKTSDAIFPKIDSNSFLFNENNLPTLVASNTVFNKGELIKYEWVDVNNVGIIFSDVNGETTTFSLPENFDSLDITICLDVYGTQGDEASTSLTLSYISDAENYLYYAEESDKQSARRSQLVTEKDAEFTITNSTSKDSITVGINGEDRLYLHLAAPNKETFTVGSYKDAGDYPFQSPTKPGLDFNSKNCQNEAEFEILELDYDLEGNLSVLAVDFLQQCESNNVSTLQGVIRFNSTIPLIK